MSRQTVRAITLFGSTGRKTPSSFLCFLYPRTFSIPVSRQSSFLVSSGVQDGGVETQQQDGRIRRVNALTSRPRDGYRPKGVKLIQQEEKIDTSVESESAQDHDQKTSNSQPSAIEDQHVFDLPSQPQSIILPAKSIERVDIPTKISPTRDFSSSTGSNGDQNPSSFKQDSVYSDDTERPIHANGAELPVHSNATKLPIRSEDIELPVYADDTEVPVHSCKIELSVRSHNTNLSKPRKIRVNQNLKVHFLDVSRAKDIYELAKKSVSNKIQRALTHDKIRSKGSWSFDWSVALLELQRALPLQRDRPSNTFSEIEEIPLANNNYIGIPASSIPMPETWDKISFAQYIHDLSRSRMPSQRRGSNSHQIMIRQRLEKLVFTASTAALVSSTALESAMRFYYKFGMLPSVQHLYSYMKKIEYPYPDALIDITLRYAAKDHDLHNFTSILREARTLGFIPSEMTWTSLLLCLVSDASRKVMLDIMRTHDLLQEKSTREDVAHRDLERALPQMSSLSDMEKLISRLDESYGQEWFNIRSANTFLKEMCKLPAGQPIEDFLGLMTKRRCKPNINSMNILLVRCYRITDLEAALKVFDHFVGRYKVVPDQASYELLFKTSWDTRYVNTCRVLWVAACVHRRATYSMRRLIEISLLTPKPKSTAKAWHRWRWQAGKLLAGFEPPSVSDTVWRVTNLAMNRPSEMKKDYVRAMSNRYVQTVMDADQSLYQRFYYPLDEIRKQLEEAYKSDREWKENGINLSKFLQTELLVTPKLKPRREVNSQELVSDANDLPEQPKTA